MQIFMVANTSTNGFCISCSPINLLTVTLHRGVYVAIFGAMSGDILAELLRVLFDQELFLPLTSDPYWNVFIQVGKESL